MTHPRRRARPEQRRAEILAAAMEIFAERGYRGASLAAVAEKVGLTQQGLLHYYPSKDALLIEVLRRRDELDIAEYGHGEAFSQIEQLVAHNAARPGLVQSFTVLSAESVTEGHPANPFFVERYAKVRAMISEAIRAELGDDLPAGLTHDQAASLLIAVMDGLQLQWLLQPQEVDMPELVHAFTALLRSR